MSNEFDYSGLYGNPPQQPVQPEPQSQPEAPAAYTAPDPEQTPVPEQAPAYEPPTAPEQAPVYEQPAAETSVEVPAQPEPQAAYSEQPAAYPNVGSSGMNTANTARTEYPDAPYTPPVRQESAYAQSRAIQPDPPRPGQNGYYTGSTGGYNGYSYSSAPPQPPVRKQKKSGGAKKFFLRLAACIGIVALSFAGGFGGAIAASRMGLTGTSVVFQQVQRVEGENVAQDSAGGTVLSLKEVSSIVTPSVVVITTEQMVSNNYIWFGGGYVQSGAGSGVVMTDDGYILTCAHVVDGAQNVKVTLPSGDEYTATVIGSDETADIAVLKIEATGLTPAVIGDSDALAVGETVVAVGNPLGQLGGTVTNGIISAINREVSVEGRQMTLIQTNAAISPGNSGGGLFNARGDLIGIVNAKSSASDESGNLTDAEGLGFAIPINTAAQIAQDLIDVGYVQRPALGITVITISDAQTAMQYGVNSYGVYIYQVNSGSGAEKAGLRVGDRIAAVEDVPVNQNDDLTGYLADLEIGDTVKLLIERNGRLSEVTVTLGASQG